MKRTFFDDYAHQEKTEKETIILRRLNHENIIKYRDAFTIQRGLIHDYYLIIEYACAGDLAKHIHQQKERGVKWCKVFVIEIFAQILCGLNYLHENKTIHRDLKPENILATGPEPGVIDFEKYPGQCKMKITDFGLSKVLERSMADASSICGSKLYMSPQIHNGDKYSYETDVFSLGCIVFELV